MRKLLLLLLPLLCLCGCDTSKEFSPDENAGMQLAKKVSIFESKDSKKQWVLLSEKVDFSNLQSATLKNPDLLLKENGQDGASITGETGTFDYAAKKVAILGKAKIQSFTENLTITADRFFYDVNKDRIWSDDKTVITRGGVKVTAKKGVETDSKFSKIELKQQTTRLPENTQGLQAKSL